MLPDFALQAHVCITVQLQNLSMVHFALVNVLELFHKILRAYIVI